MLGKIFALAKPYLVELTTTKDLRLTARTLKLSVMDRWQNNAIGIFFNLATQVARLCGTRLPRACH